MDTKKKLNPTEIYETSPFYFDGKVEVRQRKGTRRVRLTGLSISVPKATQKEAQDLADKLGLQMIELLKTRKK